MKKFFLIISFIAFVVPVYIFDGFANLALNSDLVPAHSQYSLISQEVYQECGAIDNLTSMLQIDTIDNYYSVKNNTNGCFYGEAVSFCGNKNKLNYIFDAINFELKLYDSMEHKEFFYGYIFGLQNDIYLHGELINIQFCYDYLTNIICIGTPVILGSF